MDLSVLERRIEILKLLQGKEMRTGDLAEYFNIDDRTVRKDIDNLRMGLDILGTEVKIESKHMGSQKHYYKSTVHPIFLALNLSELYAILQLLENRSNNLDDPSKEIYGKLFNKIYSQITEYAEARIAHLLKGKYDKVEVINTLEEDVFNRSMNLIYWLKSERFIEINYEDDYGNNLQAEVKLVDIEGYILRVEDKKGGQMWVDYNDVVVEWEKVGYK